MLIKYFTEINIGLTAILWLSWTLIIIMITIGSLYAHIYNLICSNKCRKCKFIKTAKEYAKADSALKQLTFEFMIIFSRLYPEREGEIFSPIRGLKRMANEIKERRE